VVTLSRSDSVLSGVARSPDGEGRKLESYGTNGCEHRSLCRLWVQGNGWRMTKFTQL